MEGCERRVLGRTAQDSRCYSRAVHSIVSARHCLRVEKARRDAPPSLSLASIVARSKVCFDSFQLNNVKMGIDVQGGREDGARAYGVEKFAPRDNGAVSESECAIYIYIYTRINERLLE